MGDLYRITEEANSDNYLAEEVRKVASIDGSDIDVDVVADVSDMPESIVVCYVSMHVYFLSRFVQSL